MKFSAVFFVACAAALVSAETNAARMARGLAPNAPVRRGTPVDSEHTTFHSLLFSLLMPLFFYQRPSVERPLPVAEVAPARTATFTAAVTSDNTALTRTSTSKSKVSAFRTMYLSAPHVVSTAPLSLSLVLAVVQAGTPIFQCVSDCH